MFVNVAEMKNECATLFARHEVNETALFTLNTLVLLEMYMHINACGRY